MKGERVLAAAAEFKDWKPTVSGVETGPRTYYTIEWADDGEPVATCDVHVEGETATFTNLWAERLHTGLFEHLVLTLRDSLGESVGTTVWRIEDHPSLAGKVRAMYVRAGFEPEDGWLVAHPCDPESKMNAWVAKKESD